MGSEGFRVCVTGGASYIGSRLVKELLERGYVVNATVTDLGDQSKTGILKSFNGAEKRLSLFQADIYDSESYEPAINGCDFVFLIATPLNHNPQSTKFKDITEAAVASISTVLRICEKTETVKKVFFAGSVTAASPLKEDGFGFKDAIDEDCWTPLDLSPPSFSTEFMVDYVHSKTSSERELLRVNERKREGRPSLEAVSLVIALVGGGAPLRRLPGSVKTLVSPLTRDTHTYNQLKFLHFLLGSVPLVHLDDLCEAFIFCLENPSMSGRFLCASDFPTLKEILGFYKENYPELLGNHEEMEEGLSDGDEEEEDEKRVKCGSRKLVEMGFKFKHGIKSIISESVEYFKSLENNADGMLVVGG